MRISSIGLIAAASLGLAGCATNGLGVGIGSGYGGGYGYDGYGYSPYGYPAYGYGAYGYPAYGYGQYAYNPWYNGYYYPGTGGWVYDRDGVRHPITNEQRSHFGKIGEKFREAVERRNAQLKAQGGTTTTTTTGVRQPARTRTIERTRSSAETRSSRREARQAARAARNKDD